MLSKKDNLSAYDAKIRELLQDTAINILKFPSNGASYEFDKKDLTYMSIICNDKHTVVEHYSFKVGDEDQRFEAYMAIKHLKIPMNRFHGVDNKQLEDLVKEVKVFRMLSSHSNIVDFYGLCLHPGEAWLCMEYMDYSLEDIYKFVHKKKDLELPKFPENIIGIIIKCLADALAFCKMKRVIHRDVKPRNVLLNKNGEIKLCDFGESKILQGDSLAETFVGTLIYFPPERFISPTHDERTDIWSLGITIVEVAHGSLPYTNTLGQSIPSDFSAIQHVIKQANPVEILQRCLSERYSPELRAFINSCLEKENSQRPTITKLMEMALYHTYTNIGDNKINVANFIKNMTEDPNINDMVDRHENMNYIIIEEFNSSISSTLTNEEGSQFCAHFYTFLKGFYTTMTNEIRENIDKQIRKLLQEQKYEAIINYLEKLSRVPFQRLKHYPGYKPKCLLFKGPCDVTRKTVLNSIKPSFESESYTTLDLSEREIFKKFCGRNSNDNNAYPGQIIQALTKIKEWDHEVKIILYNIDSLFEYDLSSSELEEIIDELEFLLDYTRNEQFVDKFVGFSVDLTNVIFTCTATSAEKLPPGILDLLEIVPLK